MKSLVFTKYLMYLSVILFADYLIMAILGCSTCLLGFGNDFYCGGFCIIGKIVLISSLILYFYLIFPEIKKYIKQKKNVKTAEE